MDQVTSTFLSHQGRRALVTGGADGIGASICMALADVGAHVSVVDVQSDKANTVVNKITEAGGTVIAVDADISTEDGCRQAVKATVDRFGGIDILVNCAAPSRNKSMLGRLAGSDWDIHQKIIINGTVLLADLSSDYLAESGSGAIVNISSVTSSSIGIDHCSWPYHVSKAGLDQLTRWLAVRLGGSGIRVNAIAPGLVDRSVGYKLSDNPGNRAIIKSVVPLGRAGNGNDIAQAVVFLSSKQSDYITGQVLTIDGGLGISENYSASLRTFNLGSSQLYEPRE